ncbi:hypothetical protein NLJ89_g2349 [Agrocybe chaxingu]|uniref:galacturonan 1,4-alpha-galacturonidase n=1 Tax=Agrocybe chaxingu TaxID=84603 RepID=A0A9W8KB79_9AGAR|nr:hypothetical protein NLJ89_g2349 [Agrocybe chaxingu]
MLHVIRIQNAFFIPFQTQVTFWLLGGENVLFDGGGMLDGAGQAWWDAYAANTSLLRPIILTVYQAKNVLVDSIQMINGPEWFNLVNEGEHVIYRNISISAVSTSNNMPRNSDGWDVYRSNDVTIVNSIIHNDDDCVSFKPNSTNVHVEILDCTGSHGISVGSLGQYPGVYDIVENVFVNNIKMANAQNGARIKAWAGPNVGSGIVKNITFQNFIETAVDNPVIIDQACTRFLCSPVFAFLLDDVWFNNITGTGTNSVVASLLCSPDGRCSNISVNDFSLSYPAGTTQYSCQNVNLTGNAASLFPPCTVT